MARPSGLDGSSPFLQTTFDLSSPLESVAQGLIQRIKGFHKSKACQEERICTALNLSGKNISPNCSTFLWVPLNSCYDSRVRFGPPLNLSVARRQESARALVPLLHSS